LWYICINSVSQQFILVPLLHGFFSFNVHSVCKFVLIVQYMHWYADIWLLFQMQRRCSLCLIVIGLPDCPMYTLLHVLQLILYVPVGFTLLGLCESCWYIVWVDRNAVFRLVCLNRLVTLRINGLQCVKVTHCLLFCYVVWCSVVKRFFLFWLSIYSSVYVLYVLGNRCFGLL
jgi:hypothetical protein